MKSTILESELWLTGRGHAEGAKDNKGDMWYVICDMWLLIILLLVTLSDLVVSVCDMCYMATIFNSSHSECLRSDVQQSTCTMYRVPKPKQHIWHQQEVLKLLTLLSSGFVWQFKFSNVTSLAWCSCKLYVCCCFCFPAFQSFPKQLNLFPTQITTPNINR